MDFDLKLFFKEPPRIKEGVKTFAHDLADKFVRRTVEHARALSIDRILPRHARLIVFQLAQDPYTRMQRGAVCVQQGRVKNMLKVFQRAMDMAETALKTDAKYGGIDKKIVKSTQSVMTSAEVKVSTAASVIIAACVAEMIGIILNSTQTLMEDRTMSLASVREYGTTHCISSGNRCINSSLVRLVHHLSQPLCIVTVSAPSREEREKLARAKKSGEHPSKESPQKKMRRLETKSVTFETAVRPSTPENCFWED